MVTAWVAVDNADEENGCMQVIPGKVWEFVHRMFILEQSEDNHNVTPLTFLSIISPRLRAGLWIERSGFDSRRTLSVSLLDWHVKDP